LKPHTVPTRIVSPLSVAFSTLSALQAESAEQPCIHKIAHITEIGPRALKSPPRAKEECSPEVIVPGVAFLTLSKAFQSLILYSAGVDVGSRS
jgi:hypothetical protein